jgi:hypothetical protein
LNYVSPGAQLGDLNPVADAEGLVYQDSETGDGI